MPQLLSIFALKLLLNRLRGQPSPFSSHVIESSGVPGESQLVLTDGWAMVRNEKFSLIFLELGTLFVHVKKCTLISDFVTSRL